jgi:hypothetical protein
VKTAVEPECGQSSGAAAGERVEHQVSLDEAGREHQGTAVQLVQRRVEASAVAGSRLVRDRPVHGGQGAEFLLCRVADFHHQVAVVPDVADGPRSQPGQWQLTADGGGDRAGVDGPPRLARAGRRAKQGVRHVSTVVTVRT